jgi:hypothetical protein
MVPDWSSSWSTLQPSGINPERFLERYHVLTGFPKRGVVPKAGVLFPLKASAII